MELRAFRRGVIAALAVTLFTAGNAYADRNRISDGNDIRGPLDIRSATHGHAGGRVVHTISTFARWRPGLLGPSTPNLFALEISTDGDRAFERVVLVYSRNGRMIARVFRLSRGRLFLIGPAAASKPNGRTVRVTIARSRLGNPAGYRSTAHSQYQAAGVCSGSCVDHAPNSGGVLHDITAPAVALTSFPAIPPDVEYDVSFRISDRGGAGLRRWLLQHRPFGTAAWTTVDSGATAGSKSHHHVSAEDADDEFRVVARDRHGNERISPLRLVSVPIDDASASLVYTGTWAHGPGDPLDFRDTLSTSATVSDTVALTFTGRYVALVSPGREVEGDGDALVSIDGAPAASVLFSTFDGRRRIVFERTFSSVATRTISIAVVDGTVPVDGIVVR
ncbi:MAG: hypothetical protein ACRDNI_12960 [Gaiellaceae bacterium]